MEYIRKNKQYPTHVVEYCLFFVYTPQKICIMSRPLPSTTLERAVRTHFGLTQDELGRYLSVSGRQINNLEAGRRRSTAATSRLLDDLARLLPPPEGTGPAAPAFEKLGPPAEAPVPELPDLGALPAAPLRKRHKQVLAQAARLRWSLHHDGKGATLQQRRQWGMGVLQAGLLAAPADPAAQAHRLRWLATLAADVAATAPDAAVAAGRALAVVRLLALDLEATALTQLLAGC